jgi:hypothetical protein
MFYRSVAIFQHVAAVLSPFLDSFRMRLPVTTPAMARGRAGETGRNWMTRCCNERCIVDALSLS